MSKASALASGHGELSAGLFATGKGAGASLDLTHRFNDRWAAYGAGVVEMSRDRKVDWTANAGIKGAW